MTSGRRRSLAAGFTLLELALVLALSGLLVGLVAPRLGVLGSAALDSSTRQLATRLRFLREEAARRSTWIRVVFDPRQRRYHAELLEQTTTGPRFVADPGPLYRPVRLPDAIGLEVDGPGRIVTGEGLPAAIFHPDGFADPVVIHLDDGAGRVQSIVIEPATPRPSVYDERVDLSGFLGAGPSR